MFEKFTEGARKSIYYAREEAHRLGANSIAPEHLLLGMLRSDPEVINKLSPSDGDHATSLRGGLLAVLKQNVPTTPELPLSRETKQVLHFVHENDIRLRQRRISVAHLLLGLLTYAEAVSREGDTSPVGRILGEGGFTKAEAESLIVAKGGI